MNKEERKLLMIDICARLPYDVILVAQNGNTIHVADPSTDVELFVDEGWRPCLRPMSSMTEEEKKEYKSIFSIGEYSCGGSYYGEEYEYICDSYDDVSQSVFLIDWLNAHHFDYRGLIDNGLAVDVSNTPYNLLKTHNFTTLDDDIIKKIEDGMYDENGLKDLGDGLKMDREGHIFGGLKFN